MKKIFILIGAVLIFSTFCAFSLSNATQPPVEAYQVVQSLRQAGQLEAAKQKAHQHLKTYPRDVDVMLILGAIYYQEKNYTEAEKWIKSVIALSPQYKDAQALLLNIQKAIAYHDAVPKSVDKKSNDSVVHHQLTPSNITKTKLVTKPHAPQKIDQRITPSTHQKLQTIRKAKLPNALGEVKPKIVDANAEKALEYFSHRRYYQAAKLGKEALWRGLSDGRIKGMLTEINSINPKYMVGVNAVGLLTTNDYVSDLKQNWDYSTLYYSRDTLYGQVIGRLNYANRFNTGATQGEIEFLPVINDNLMLDLDVAGANQPQLFPYGLLSAESYFYFPKFLDFSFGAKYANLGNPFFRVYTGSLSKDFANYWLNFRPYHFVPKSSRCSTFYTATVRRYFGTPDCYLNLTLGYGRTPDLNDLQLADFFVIDNRVANLTVQLPLFHHKMALVLGADYQRQIYPTGLVRNLTGGIMGVECRF